MNNLKSNLSCFYIPEIESSTIHLSEEESKHAIKVLRLRKGDYVLVTNGKGKLAQAQIVDNHKTDTLLQIESIEELPPSKYHLHIALSMLQHPERFEWFVEKAVELGISEITPILCARTEKKQINIERIKKTAIVALKQSRQAYLPKINEAQTFTSFVQNCQFQNKAIAMCVGNRKEYKKWLQNISNSEQVVLVGPEGDFAPSEIELALKYHFTPISLGNSILRSETAAIYIAAALRFQI